MNAGLRPFRIRAVRHPPGPARYGRPRHLVLILAVLLVVAFSSPLATEEFGMTAEEMAQAGAAAFQAQDWEQTVGLLNRLLGDFGESEEIRPALPRLLPMLAMSQIYLRQFEPARVNLERALDIGDLEPAAEEELRFWKGICEMQAGELEASRDSFLEYVERYPGTLKAPEAVLLAGSNMVLLGENERAAEYFATIKDDLAADGDRARATVLQLYSLVEADQLDDALVLLVEEYPNMGEMPQLITFQTIALDLGSRFMETEEYRKAIAALQRIWNRDRLMEHQEQRLEELTQRLEAARRRTAEAFLAFQLNQIVTKVRREIETFGGIEHFDSALRLRLASAFQSMQRYREAALIMEEMLQRMPPDPVVEQASLNLVQCWMTIDRWPKAVEAADLFMERFPDSEHVPLVMLMKGQAMQSDGLYEESIETLNALVERYPASTYAPRALFLAGFGHLLMENYQAAIPVFESFPGQYPDDDLEDTVFYWLGMAWSMDSEHEKARDLMTEYLERFPEGRWVGEADFRRTYSAHSLADYDTSIPEFRAFIQTYPGHVRQDEAYLLLGDALMAEGALEQGMEAYAKINPHSRQFFEQGWFQTGRALRLLEDNEGLRAHMQTFIDDHYDSSRLAEAIYWVGWTYRNDGDPAKAVEVYWDAIESFGNDPRIFSVEDLFPALARLYSGDDERAMYFARLRDLRELADDRGEETLALRALWAQSKFLERSEPERARKILAGAAERIDVEEHNPLLMVDIADALRERGDTEAAAEVYAETLRWNPRAPQRDRVFAGLGLLAMEEGRERAALDYFERFERETFGSPLYAEIMLAKAELEAERGMFDKAQETLEEVLGHETTGGQDRVRALYALGELMMRAGRPDRAVPYYQRIYVMYGRWTDYVAKAYLRSGEAFEQLDDQAAAINTYAELVGREELAEFDEVESARRRLDELGHEPEPEVSDAA